MQNSESTLNLHEHFTLRSLLEISLEKDLPSKKNNSLLEEFNPIWFLVPPWNKEKSLSPRNVIHKIGGCTLPSLIFQAQLFGRGLKPITNFCNFEIGNELFESFLKDMQNTVPEITGDSQSFLGCERFWKRLPYHLMLLLKSLPKGYIVFLRKMPERKRFQTIFLLYLSKILKEKDELKNYKRDLNCFLYFNPQGDLCWVEVGQTPWEPSGYNFIVACLNNLLSEGFTEFDEYYLNDIQKISINSVMDELTKGSLFQKAKAENSVLRGAIARFSNKMIIGPIFRDAKRIHLFFQSHYKGIEDVLLFAERYQAQELLKLRQAMSPAPLWNTKKIEGDLTGLAKADLYFWDSRGESINQGLAKLNLEDIENIVRRCNLNNLCQMLNFPETCHQISKIMQSPEVLLAYDERSTVCFEIYLKNAKKTYKHFLESIKCFLSNNGLFANENDYVLFIQKVFQKDIKQVSYLNQSLPLLLRRLGQKVITILKVHPLADELIKSDSISKKMDLYSSELGRHFEAPIAWEDAGNIFDILATHTKSIPQPKIISNTMPFKFRASIDSQRLYFNPYETKEILISVQNLLEKNFINSKQKLSIIKCIQILKDIDERNFKKMACEILYQQSIAIEKYANEFEQIIESKNTTLEQIMTINKELNLGNLLIGLGLDELKNWTRLVISYPDVILVRPNPYTIYPAQVYLSEVTIIISNALSMIVKFSKDAIKNELSTQSFWQAILELSYAQHTIPNVLEDLENRFKNLQT